MCLHNVGPQRVRHRGTCRHWSRRLECLRRKASTEVGTSVAAASPCARPSRIAGRSKPTKPSARLRALCRVSASSAVWLAGPAYGTTSGRLATARPQYLWSRRAAGAAGAVEQCVTGLVLTTTQASAYRRRGSFVAAAFAFAAGVRNSNASGMSDASSQLTAVAEIASQATRKLARSACARWSLHSEPTWPQGRANSRISSVMCRRSAGLRARHSAVCGMPLREEIVGKKFRDGGGGGGIHTGRRPMRRLGRLHILLIQRRRARRVREEGFERTLETGQRG